jgi:hypothetical protein
MQRGVLVEFPGQSFRDRLEWTLSSLHIEDKANSRSNLNALLFFPKCQSRPSTKLPYQQGKGAASNAQLQGEVPFVIFPYSTGPQHT